MVELHFYIAAAASVEISERYTEAIVQQCESLATFPYRGTQRDDIRPGLRVFGFRRRISIVFEVTEGIVTILGIYYGGQNLETAFEEWLPLVHGVTGERRVGLELRPKRSKHLLVGHS